MIFFKNIKKFWQNGEFESSNGEKWSPGSDRPPLVDKMDIVEALAPLQMHTSSYKFNGKSRAVRWYIGVQMFYFGVTSDNHTEND